MFASNMVMPARFPEEKWIAGAIKPPQGVFIEGGNVILGKDEVFLGIGDRTNREAAEWLHGQLGTGKQVVPFLLKPGVLHLDCAFCPIEERDGTQGSALVYSGAFESPKDLQLLQSMYGDL
jgi:N-dimethylarginine dimethylaminohydrolase